MHPECAPAALGKHLEISSCLCSLHDPKSIFLTRHRQVVRVVAGHLQEDAAIRPAFVGLSSGMEEARTKAETYRDMLLVANQMTEPATAVAISHRKNSCPRSYVSTTEIRITGWPAFSRTATLASCCASGA